MLALLLVDLQYGLCNVDGVGGKAGIADQVAARGVLPVVARCLDAARQSGVEVVYVRLAFEPGFVNRTNRTARFHDHENAGRFLAGSADAEICEDIRPLDSERVLNKGSVSPFASTGLLEELTRSGVTEVFLVGVATNLAIESAAREAADRGLLVTVLADACAAAAPELHEYAIASSIPPFATIATSEDFLAACAAARGGQA